jgi:hypothetical protein
VIAIPLLLLLLAGTIVAATKTVCTYRTEPVADMDPLSWQFVQRVGHGLEQWWHCKEFVAETPRAISESWAICVRVYGGVKEFVTKKVVPAIEHLIKVP